MRPSSKLLLAALSFLLWSFAFVSFAAAGDGFFFDVEPSHPFFGAITALKTEGVLEGFSDHTFRPDAAVNRAEALKMILSGSGITAGIAAANPFPDVEKGAWYAPFISEAKRRGIVRGTAEGIFAPERTVNQAEALQMILLVNDIELPAADSTWYAPLYIIAKNRSLLEGQSENPAGTLTRGELAAIMYRFDLGMKSHLFPLGTISYYAGKNTAAGTEFTAAHREYALGSKVLVSSLTTGRAVVAQVADRGPYVPFRHLDLSKEAFAAIDSLGVGLTKGEILPVEATAPLGAVERLCTLPDERRIIPTDAFTGINLDAPLPALFRQHEIFLLSGRAPGAKEVTAFWTHQGEKQRFTVPVINDYFALTIPFLEAGTFDFGLILGTAGESRVFPLQVASGPCLIGQGEQPTPIANLSGDIRGGKYTLRWSHPTANFFRVLFTQEDRKLEFFVHGLQEFTPPPALFAEWNPGPAEVRVFAAGLASPFSADVSTPFSASRKLDLELGQHYFSEVDRAKVTNFSFPETFTRGVPLNFKMNFSGQIQENAVVLFPDGSMSDHPLAQSTGKATLSFTPQVVGTHIIEINGSDGIALANVPLYSFGVAPLLPDYFDLHPRETAPRESLDNIPALRGKMLALLNGERRAAGLPELIIQRGLNELAQFRSEDMQQRDYFGHTTPDGKDLTDIKIEFGVKAPVSENIAFDVNIAGAHEGLMRSALHRRNLFNPDWRFTGIGIAPSESGGVLVTIVFAGETMTNEKRDEYRAQVLETLNDRRDTALSLDHELTKVATLWTERMAKEDFFAARSPNGDTLKDLLNESGISGPIQTAFYQYETLSELLRILSERTDSPFLLDAKWRKTGIGLYVDDTGVLTVALFLGE